MKNRLVIVLWILSCLNALAQPANVMSFHSSLSTSQDTNPTSTHFQPSVFQWGMEPAFRIQDYLDSIYYLITDLRYVSRPGFGSAEEDQLYVALYHLSQLVEATHDDDVDVGDTLVSRHWANRESNNRLHFPIIRLSSVDLDSFSDRRGSDPPSRTVHVRNVDHLERMDGYPRGKGPKFLENSSWGLDAGLGFYAFLSHPEGYYVNGSGNVESRKMRGGTHLSLNAHLYWTQNEIDKYFLCLPIVALTGNAPSRIGLISSRPSVGVGYARMFGGMGAYVSLVSAPYKQYDHELLSTIEPHEPRFEKVDLTEYPSDTRHFLITSFGLNIPIY